jgi:hypothetical protein
LILSKFCTFLLLVVSACADCAGSGLPNSAETSAILSNIRQWITNDLQIDAAQTAASLPKESIVCLVLRHHGEVIGVGTSNVGSANPVAESAQFAFAEVAKNSVLRRLTPANRNNAMLSLSIELEIGASPEPSPSKQIEHIAWGITQGIEGIAVRKGKKWALRMPAELRLAPTSDSANTIWSLCIEVGVHPATALSGHLPPSENATVYTIPTTTVLQDRAGDSVRQLFRGDEYISIFQITPSTMRELADTIATHLIRCTNRDGFVIGGYQPETDSLAPPHATVFVQLVVASALEAYYSNPKATKSQEAKIAIGDILSNIVLRYEGETPIADSIAASIVIFMQTHSDTQEESLLLYSHCKKQVIESCNKILRKEQQNPKPHVFAMLADALASIALETNNAALQTLSIEFCTLALTETPLENQFSMIPWIIDAAQKSFEEGLEHASIQNLLGIALATQNNDGNELDLLGGFSLIASNSSVIDARGVRMVPMLARFAQVPNANQHKAMQALIKALRFVAQLTTDQNHSNRFANPSLALGGVRKAAWDASMPTEASAMALLGVSRAITAFDVSSKGQ